MTIDDAVIEVKKLSLAQGDLVVVKVTYDLSEEETIRLKKLLDGGLPEGVKGIVVDDNINVEVLTRAEIERLAAA